MRSGDLFSDAALDAFLAQHGERAMDALDTLDHDVLLTTPIPDLVDAIVEDVGVKPLALHTDRITQRPTEETDVDVRHDYRYRIPDRNQPWYAPAAQIGVEIPFDGDPVLFTLAPSSSLVSVPSGHVAGSTLFLMYDSVDPDPVAASLALDEDLRAVEQAVAASSAEVRAFLDGLARQLAASMEARRARLLRNRGLEGALGVPVRRRDDAPATPVPTVRKRVGLRDVRRRTHEPYRDEYRLADEHYESVLDIIAGMRLMFERSPSTFAKLAEEEIRDHILVQLNGTFEGRAGGELFNGAGKTDIVVRVEDRNVFIAECKYWSGEKNFAKAIDQLLGYLVWRDTKAAIVLFIRQKDATSVIERALAALTRHPSFKRFGARTGDITTRTDIVLHQLGDPAREITVALMPLVIRTT